VAAMPEEASMLVFPAEVGIATIAFLARILTDGTTPIILVDRVEV